MFLAESVFSVDSISLRGGRRLFDVRKAIVMCSSPRKERGKRYGPLVGGFGRLSSAVLSVGRI